MKYLQDKLSVSVRTLKNQHGWRKIREQSFMPPRTVYECTYSEINGFHPHVHMLFFQKNILLTKTKIRETLSPYWNNYTGGNVDVCNVNDKSKRGGDGEITLNKLYIEEKISKNEKGGRHGNDW